MSSVLLAEFTVIGTPAAQGSKRQIRTKTGVPIMVEASKNLRPWRDSVAAQAADTAATCDAPFDGELELFVRFRWAMPKSRPKYLRLGGWAWKSSTPDLDKLIRAVGDALKVAGLVVDDARFARIIAEKVEVDGSWTGAQIKLSRLSNPGVL